MNENLIHNLIAVVIIIAIAWILIRVNHKIFRKIQQKREGLHLRLAEYIITVVILISAVILLFTIPGGFDSIWKTLLGGTAIISAVAVFAAQDVIRDLLAGMMLSIFRPFEIGNRIELEDGTGGVVLDMTMRHVVIRTWDAQKLVIPNSIVNTQKILNNSEESGIRTIQFFFHIAYGTDVAKAMEVIRQAVQDSPYSIPGRETEDGKAYGSVYFMAYEDSSLQMATTVYFEPSVRSEVVRSDINLRVYTALEENGIEIPYKYVNIIQKQ